MTAQRPRKSGHRLRWPPPRLRKPCARPDQPLGHVGVAHSGIAGPYAQSGPARRIETRQDLGPARNGPYPLRPARLRRTAAAAAAMEAIMKLLTVRQPCPGRPLPRPAGTWL